MVQVSVTAGDVGSRLGTVTEPSPVTGSVATSPEPQLMMEAAPPGMIESTDTVTLVSGVLTNSAGCHDGTGQPHSVGPVSIRRFRRETCGADGAASVRIPAGRRNRRPLRGSTETHLYPQVVHSPINSCSATLPFVVLYGRLASAAVATEAVVK